MAQFLNSSIERSRRGRGVHGKDNFVAYKGRKGSCVECAGLCMTFYVVFHKKLRNECYFAISLIANLVKKENKQYGNPDARNSEP